MIPRYAAGTLVRYHKTDRDGIKIIAKQLYAGGFYDVAVCTRRIFMIICALDDEMARKAIFSIHSREPITPSIHDTWYLCLGYDGLYAITQLTIRSADDPCRSDS